MNRTGALGRSHLRWLRTQTLCSAVAVLSLPALSAAGLAQGQGKPTMWYVSTRGNDGWSGRLAEANAAGTDGPFATLGRARDAIRGLRKAGPLPGPVTVQVRGGKYFVTDTLFFTAADSGTADCPVTYCAYPGERPELIGGRRISGFQPADRGMVVAFLPQVKAGQWYFRQLFAEDRRQIRARFPNFDPKDPTRGGFLYVDRGPNGFGGSVGNIHNPGDWMRYKVQVPAPGRYQFWMLYGADNAYWGTPDMGGHTVLVVDDGPPVPLLHLPDTGGWGEMKWSCAATVQLTAGEHRLQWLNVKGGGLNLSGYALSDDPDWRPVSTNLPRVAPGKHLIVIQAEDFTDFNGRQLSVSDSGGEGSRTSFHYKAGTFKASWAKAPGAEVHIFQGGNCRAFKEILSLEGVDEQTRTVTVGGPEASSTLQTGDRYFVENAFEELDSPGEWYLSRETGALYFMPPQGPGAEPAAVEGLEVIAPTVGRILQLDGDAQAGRPVSHLAFRGLTFRVTDYSPQDGCDGYGMGHSGTVHLKDAVGCAVEDCTFHNTGTYAVCVAGGGGNRVDGNEIGDSAEGGILILRSGRNTVTNNHIHHLGAVYKHIGGVVMEGEGTDDNVISHNHIHDSSRYGISIKTGGFRNRIEYNRIERTNLETYDTGGIEVTQQDREQRSGSLIDHNIVADTVGYSFDGKHPVYLSWGIYLDSFAGGYTVTNNICYRSAYGGIMLQGGKDNRVENNIFVDGRYSQGHLSNFAGNSTGLVLQCNIIAYHDPEAVLFLPGALGPGVLRSDRNLLFHYGGKEVLVGGESLANWQKRGFDVHSVVADPLFVDPAHDDYRLGPDSPAFGLGFQAIDTRGVGRVAGSG